MPRVLLRQLRSMAGSEEEEFIICLCAAPLRNNSIYTFNFITVDHYFSPVEQLCSFVFIIFTTLQTGSDCLCELFSQILLLVDPRLQSWMSGQTIRIPSYSERVLCPVLYPSKAWSCSSLGSVFVDCAGSFGNWLSIETKFAKVLHTWSIYDKRCPSDSTISARQPGVHQ